MPNNNPERRRAVTRACERRKRIRAIDKMGGQCRACGFDDWRALQFDHIEAIQRGKNRKWDNAKRTVNEVLAMPFPDEKYQLLCANCHMIKTRNGGEFDAHDRKQQDLFGFS